MRLRHTIPAKSLQNGKSWYAILYVVDASGKIISEKSNSIVFYCFTTPSLQFVDAPQNLIVKNSVYQAKLNYRQAENEPLEQYQIFLCDLSQNPIQSSGVKYDSDLSAVLSGLSDNGRYYIHATGKTLHGIEIETPYILINVEYILPSLFTIVNLENIGSKGYIKIESNMVQIEGYSNPFPPKYINNQMVDLLTPGTYVGFSKGFNFSKNFSLAIKLKNPKQDKPIIQWDDGKYQASLYYRQGRYRSNNNVLMGFYELRVSFPLGNVIYGSRYFTTSTINSLHTVWIRKVNDIYSVELGSEVS